MVVGDYLHASVHGMVVVEYLHASVSGWGSLACLLFMDGMLSG